jgi:hypothetical protein
MRKRVCYLMSWDIEYTDEFGEWWDSLSSEEQTSVSSGVHLLEERGPQLGFPYSTQIATSKHGQMRELRVQHKGVPYRVLYAFDPRRVALLLLGGTKVGDDRWYERFVPRADALFDAHLKDFRG